MSSSNAHRFLDGSVAGDLDLALEASFSARVVEKFRNKTILWDNNPPVILKKEIEYGSAWQFVMSAEMGDPDEHTPGDELLGQLYAFEDNTITIDRITVSHADLPIDYLAQSHFDAVGSVSDQLAYRLAKFYESRLLRTAINGAKAAAVTKSGLTVHNGGNLVTNSGGFTTRYALSTTGADNFRADCALLARRMDEDDVPESSRYMIATPYIRQVLGYANLSTLYSNAIFNRDMSASTPNSAVNRSIVEIEGFKIIGFSNLMPSTNISSGPTKYQGNFTATDSGGLGQPAAVVIAGAQEGIAGLGMVQAGGLYTHMSRDERRNTMFMKAQMFCGFGYMHPQCLGAIGVTT